MQCLSLRFACRRFRLLPAISSPKRVPRYSNFSIFEHSIPKTYHHSISTKATTMKGINVMGTDEIARSVLELSFPKHPVVLSADLVKKANDILISRGYKQETTLFASSCCSDEINRLIDHQMEFWGEHFQLGGLAGYPFVGRTGFSAYQSHMPEHNGKLFILCAAHVGISKAGNLGYCDRPGMDHESKACGSALAAYFQLLSESVHHEMSCSEALAAHDLQQFLITKLVYSRLEEIKQSENPIATLSLVLAEENFKELCAIIPPDFDRSEVAILSGLEVNTHHDADDFFIPLNFTIRHKDGSYENVLPNLLDILQK